MNTWRNLQHNWKQDKLQSFAFSKCDERFRCIFRTRFAFFSAPLCTFEETVWRSSEVELLWLVNHDGLHSLQFTSIDVNCKGKTCLCNTKQKAHKNLKSARRQWNLCKRGTGLLMEFVFLYCFTWNAVFSFYKCNCLRLDCLPWFEQMKGKQVKNP